MRNLTYEFGDIPINETSFPPYGEGFLVVSRGYDGGVRLSRTDGSFRHLETAVPSSEYEFVARIGRPRLFEKEGRFYLMGRNYTQPFPEHPMQLCLFRIDPETLKIRSFSILDNAEQANVTDGYYAATFWNRRAGKDYFNVITYKGVDEADPDLFLFEFLWDEVR